MLSAFSPEFMAVLEPAFIIRRYGTSPGAEQFFSIAASPSTIP
jgi:hypothetical protein